MESPIPATLSTGLHCACIMDGCTRWAESRGMSAVDGYVEGARAVGRAARAARRLGLSSLTLAPAGRVAASYASEGMRAMVGEFLEQEADRCARDGIRIVFTASHGTLTGGLGALALEAERATAQCHALQLRIDTGDSARETILHAALRVRDASELARRRFAAAVTGQPRALPPAGDMDILVRTGGVHRLDDRLLWESAHAEIVFTDTLWPDFGEDDLECAVLQWNEDRPRHPLHEQAPVAVMPIARVASGGYRERWLR
ncbi:MAG: isoprenyl transferase [bacterium]|nr:isoprenyl transferase [bacterium]